MKCINAEVLKYHIKSRTKEGQKKVSLSTVMDIIDRQTPVPLESVVHCKDCRHLFNGVYRKNCCEVLMAKAKWVLEIAVDENWSCADGVQKSVLEVKQNGKV